MLKSYMIASKLTVFLGASLSENYSLLGTDMSAVKYPSIFSRQMEAIVYISTRIIVSNYY